MSCKPCCIIDYCDREKNIDKLLKIISNITPKNRRDITELARIKGTLTQMNVSTLNTKKSNEILEKIYNIVNRSYKHYCNQSDCTSLKKCYEERFNALGLYNSEQCKNCDRTGADHSNAMRVDRMRYNRECVQKRGTTRQKSISSNTNVDKEIVDSFLFWENQAKTTNQHDAWCKAINDGRLPSDIRNANVVNNYIAKVKSSAPNKKMPSAMLFQDHVASVFRGLNKEHTPRRSSSSSSSSSSASKSKSKTKSKSKSKSNSNSKKKSPRKTKSKTKTKTKPKSKPNKTNKTKKKNKKNKR